MGEGDTISKADEKRLRTIVQVLDDAFGELMRGDPAGFRGKYRKMAADPHAFYRGTACLFYNDVTSGAARDTGSSWDDGRSGRIWIHGDLHVENFGTYLNSDGRLVFDVNDFDEAYIGRWTWDLQRFAASLALVGWQKALPKDDVEALIADYVGAYLDQVDAYASGAAEDFALLLDNTDGPIHAVLASARMNRRTDLLDANTTRQDGDRVFIEDSSVRRLGVEEQSRVVEAYRRYQESIPQEKRRNALFYELRDVVGKSGFGIGSAGLPAYNLLIEGHSQALDNDVLLSMKQANVPAVSRFVDTSAVEKYFDNEGHRTVVSQRSLQVHTDPLLGWTDIDGVGYMIAEVSPYEVDLEWDDLVEPDQIRRVVTLLGRATAKVHCASDSDSEQDLVDFQVEEAVRGSVGEKREELVSWLVDFGLRYADQVRSDHGLFVEAFRSGRIGLEATGS
ncbi:DUF2252 domain-containing protein [Nocardioides acrostichi]|uniref:DUF2252 domain-containing protein n=1 Tax=Nocardioides acrostichi TaxID=2784339 RepID=A0A930V3E2_9ACTN|nr:DUF2252 domain-containing protein [Nocardioides acrostichi]MBF4163126.1 DUF2252 domain-containing protein [Nocardioides acrostichi]